MAAKYSLDVRGLSCPAPLLKARLGLQALAAGESIEVLVTDPASARDIQRMVELTNNTVVRCDYSEAVYRYILKKGRS